jgi:GT2 family glycosyltransferase
VMTRIAVLMACHNRRHLTLRALDQLRAQRGTTELLVYLVDDGSTDGTGQAVRETHPEVTVIDGHGDLYWCRAMDLAWRSAEQARPDGYLWLNDDVDLHTDAVERLVNTYERWSRTSNEEAIVVGTVSDTSSSQITYGGYRRTSRWHPGRLERVDPEPDNPVRIDTMNGNVVLVPTGCYRTLGPMDAAFSHATGDIDYGYRAGSNGVPVVLAPGIVGSCERNPPVNHTLRSITGKKGLPWRDWLRFTRRHTNGGLWPVAFSAPYARAARGSFRRRPKVLWISPTYRSYRQPVIDQLSDALSNAGLSLAVAVSRPASRSTQPGDHPPSQVRTLPAWTITLKGRNVTVTGWARHALGAAVVVLPEHLGSPTTWTIAVARHLLHRPTVVFGHGRDQATDSRTKESLRALLARLCGWWLAYNDASRDVVIQQLGLPPERVRPVYNTVDVRPLLAAARASSVHSRRGEVRLLYIGALYPQKQVPKIIEAVGIARQWTERELRLRIVGDGADRHHVAKLASTREWIDVEGSIIGPERGRFWAEADIALLPSSTGLAVVEAMAFGVPPIIDSDCRPGGPEVTYVDDGVQGIHRPLGDSAAGWASAIVELAEDEPRRRALGDEARATGSTLTIDRMVAAMADTLIELAHGRRG